MKKISMLTFALMLAGVMTAHAADLIVIAHKNVSVSSLSRAQAQNIFLGKDVLWPDGKKINPVVLKGGSTHEAFLSNVLGRSSAQFESYWKKAIFTGTGRPPKVAASEAEMIQLVSGTECAVGYIDSGTAHADVKRIEVK